MEMQDLIFCSLIRTSHQYTKGVPYNTKNRPSFKVSTSANTLLLTPHHCVHPSCSPCHPPRQLAAHGGIHARCQPLTPHQPHGRSRCTQGGQDTKCMWGTDEPSAEIVSAFINPDI